MKNYIALQTIEADKPIGKLKENESFSISKEEFLDAEDLLDRLIKLDYIKVVTA